MMANTRLIIQGLVVKMRTMNRRLSQMMRFSGTVIGGWEPHSAEESWENGMSIDHQVEPSATIGRHNNRKLLSSSHFLKLVYHNGSNGVKKRDVG